MTTNDERALVLTRALEKSFDHDASVGDLYTDDVKAWTPGLSTSSLSELQTETERRDEAFSDVEVEVTPLEAGRGYACAEWVVSMTHTGPFALGAGSVVEATGTRLTLYGVTVAEFRGDKICSLRQYFDRLSVLEQLGLLSEEAVPGQPG
jgi:ketosteroid isomerase-like protein